MSTKERKRPAAPRYDDAFKAGTVRMVTEEGLDSTTIRMPDYKGKSISGRVVTARKVDRSTGSKTLSLIHIWKSCTATTCGPTAKS